MLRNGNIESNCMQYVIITSLRDVDVLIIVAGQSANYALSVLKPFLGKLFHSGRWYDTYHKNRAVYSKLIDERVDGGYIL